VLDGEPKVRISLSKSGLSFSVSPQQSVLDAALCAGLNLPHSCKGGNCGACRARLVKGEIRYPNGRPLALSDAEVSGGDILLCQARAVDDLVIDTLEMRSPDAAEIRRLPCRIERVDALSHDVLGVQLRLPAAEPLQFQPGQYLDFMLPGGRRRSFSIASPPHDSRLIELHVRRVAGGEFTTPLFEGNARGALMSIEGPLGNFVYRAGNSPMVLVGGGTGLAPLMSILRHVLENGLNRDMTLYWGVRGERDAYADERLASMARGYANFRYHLVLSEPSPGWRGKRGWVHEAVLEDGLRLDVADIFASGPPAMIEAVRREFAMQGADPARLSFDSFDYAPDTLERQRTIALTRS
jgi:CDP-4-dehydro-6-deoxyglucose reductase